MKKFSFRLQSFLKLKEMSEKQKLYALAEITSQIDKNNQIIDFYYKESSRLYGGKTSADLNNDLRFLNRQYLSGLQQKMRIAERDNVNLQPQLKERQAALLQAQKEKKVVEKLKEKKYQEYKLFISKEELKEIDDFNDKINNYI